MNKNHEENITTNNRRNSNLNACSVHTDLFHLCRRFGQGQRYWSSFTSSVFLCVHSEHVLYTVCKQCNACKNPHEICMLHKKKISKFQKQGQECAVRGYDIRTQKGSKLYPKCYDFSTDTYSLTIDQTAGRFHMEMRGKAKSTVILSGELLTSGKCVHSIALNCPVWLFIEFSGSS